MRANAWPRRIRAAGGGDMCRLVWPHRGMPAPVDTRKRPYGAGQNRPLNKSDKERSGHSLIAKPQKTGYSLIKFHEVSGRSLMNATPNTIPRQRLDQRFESMKPASRYHPPPKGWIRAIRDALGMTGAQLGRHIGVTAQSVADIEKSEASGTIQLKTLRRVAEALDCVVVYALVPKSSLDDMVQRRAHEIAREELARIAHTMDLEAQGLSAQQRDEQIEAWIRDHLRDRDLWEKP